MSLGFRGYWQDFVPIIRILRQNRVLPVIAVGNEGPGTSRSPGNYVEVVSVGAIDKSRKVAWFSSSQRFQRQQDPTVPDLVAPGVGIISALPGNSWGEKSGTSMATPHIAGLFALLCEAQPNASIDDLQRALLAACKPLQGELPERYGRGLPDAVMAYQELTGHTPNVSRGAGVSLSGKKSKPSTGSGASAGKKPRGKK